MIFITKIIFNNKKKLKNGFKFINRFLPYKLIATKNLRLKFVNKKIRKNKINYYAFSSFFLKIINFLDIIQNHVENNFL